MLSLFKHAFGSLDRWFAMAAPLLLAGLAMPLHGQNVEPFTIEQVVILVEGGVSDERIIELISANCLASPINNTTERRLRRAQASSRLVTSLKRMCVANQRPERPPPASQPPPSRARRMPKTFIGAEWHKGELEVVLMPAFSGGNVTSRLNVEAVHLTVQSFALTGLGGGLGVKLANITQEGAGSTSPSTEQLILGDLSVGYRNSPEDVVGLMFTVAFVAGVLRLNEVINTTTGTTGLDEPVAGGNGFGALEIRLTPWVSIFGSATIEMLWLTETQVRQDYQIDRFVTTAFGAGLRIGLRR